MFSSIGVVKHRFNIVSEMQLLAMRNIRYLRKNEIPEEDMVKTADPFHKDNQHEDVSKIKSFAEKIRQKNIESKQKLKIELDKVFGIAENVHQDEEVTAENQFKKLAEVVTPLWKVPYNDQLKMKLKKNKLILQTFAHRSRLTGAYIPRMSSGLPCNLRHVKPSPIQEQYRNKDEFNVQVGVDGNSKTVGLYVGSWANKMVTVPADNIIISKDSHKAVAKAFENYIRSSSHPTCLNFNEGGVWRQIRVRSNEAGDLMAIVVVNPSDLSEEAILDEQNQLKEYFTNGPGSSCNLKSLYFQTCIHTRCTHEQSPFRLLFGEPYLNETLNDLEFQISPESFFQCNKRAAEVLYKTICNLPIKDRGLTVLDLCCGTGTIGLTMARQVKQVIGIESNRQAIIDASRNAVVNGIKNVNFFVGPVQSLVDDALKSCVNDDVIAIANPNRGGLTFKVIDALRKSKSVHQLIYISCQPEGPCMQDFERLCLPSARRKGTPFVLRDAVPVDLFPHTYHCELVLLFEHLNE